LQIKIKFGQPFSNHFNELNPHPRLSGISPMGEINCYIYLVYNNITCILPLVEGIKRGVKIA
jgi:hypothetical protein